MHCSFAIINYGLILQHNKNNVVNNTELYKIWHTENYNVCKYKKYSYLSTYIIIMCESDIFKHFSDLEK